MKLILLLVPSLAAAQIVTLCDQFGTWSSVGYNVYNSLFGQGSATSGSKCTSVDTNALVGVGWHTVWQWTGGANIVKSRLQLQGGRDTR